MHINLTAFLFFPFKWHIHLFVVSPPFQELHGEKRRWRCSSSSSTFGRLVSPEILLWRQMRVRLMGALPAWTWRGRHDTRVSKRSGSWGGQTVGPKLGVNWWKKEKKLLSASADGAADGAAGSLLSRLEVHYGRESEAIELTKRWSPRRAIHEETAQLVCSCPPIASSGCWLSGWRRRCGKRWGWPGHRERKQDSVKQEVEW